MFKWLPWRRPARTALVAPALVEQRLAAAAQVLRGQAAGRGGQDLRLVVETMLYLFGAPDGCLRCGRLLRKAGAPPVVMKDVGSWLCEFDSPLGPGWVAPREDAERPSRLLQLTIAQVLEGRTKGRSGDDYMHGVDAMTLLFGRDGGCLVCGKVSTGQTRADGRTPKDVDSWFCRADCPVCEPLVGETEPRRTVWPREVAS